MSWVLQTTGPFSWLFNFHDVSSHLNDLPSYTISNLIHDFLPFLHRYDDEKCIKSMKKKKLGIWNLLLTDLEYQLLELWVNTLTLYQSLIKFLNLSWNWRDGDFSYHFNDSSAYYEKCTIIPALYCWISYHKIVWRYLQTSL